MLYSCCIFICWYSYDPSMPNRALVLFIFSIWHSFPSYMVVYSDHHGTLDATMTQLAHETGMWFI